MTSIRPLRLRLLAALALVTAGFADAGARTDPTIAEIVASVSQARVTAAVQGLQDFQTRHTVTAGNTQAGDWLLDRFLSWGLEAERHSFTYGGTTEHNIVARLPGTSRPDEIVIISGHFDSTSENPYVLAPGADDNASGVAAVLEAAYLLRSYEFERTVEFVCFNVEEQGRIGSAAFAADYQAAGRNIVAVLNMDMIGYWPTGWARDLDVMYEPVSEWVADRILLVNQQYVGIPAAKHLSGMCRDDHWSFTQRGIPGITNGDCWEAHNTGTESTPHYHRTTDTIGTLNLPCMTQAVQVAIAALADLAGPLASSAVGPGPAGDTLRLKVVPNPVAGSAEISYAVPSGAPAVLRVFDASGRLVGRLDAAGRGSLPWARTGVYGRPLPSGSYVLELSSGSWRTVARVVVIE